MNHGASLFIYVSLLERFLWGVFSTNADYLEPTQSLITLEIYFKTESLS